MARNKNNQCGVATYGVYPTDNVIDLDKLSWAQHWISTRFANLEILLAETSGRCCLGDDISVADLCLVPQVYNALRYEVDMTPYPIISKINAYLLTVEAFKQSHPSNQPDCPADQKTQESQNLDDLIHGDNPWAKHWITTRFANLEALLAQSSGRCCVGDGVTVADICLVPQVFNAINFGVDVNAYPLINKINSHLLSLDPFRHSHPFRQADCPPELRLQ
ncbi:unnamed protein product [Oppiella nova]|uniref:GST C-terminal domain-containing protein n=1 Tax=Oppiella nova TaxID=334625 RepID=A0A7R9QVL0_9ACAR|nr:unnamed protein product [Oppiella nova]CAG2177235.1 unnamed protein product [Oppiella nova]